MSGRVRLVPALPVPVLETANLAASLAWYRDVLGFTLVQRVPGVVAVLRLGDVRFQLWQMEAPSPQDCRLVLDGKGTCIFWCHSRIARAARCWVAASPTLQPWGAWEMTVADPHGNLLRFTQWAGAGASQEGVRPHEEDSWKDT